MDLVELKRKEEEKEAAAKSKKTKLKDLGKAPEKKPESEIAATKRKETIKISYENEDGKVLTSECTSLVMDSDMRLRFERIQSELAQGINFAQVGYDVMQRHQGLARIIVQLQDAPEWVLKAAGEDLVFCYELGGRLVKHENMFFRYPNAYGEGETGSPRFSID